MIFRGFLTLSLLSSVVFLPWPFTTILAIGASFFEPLLPLSAGLLMDTFYYTPASGTVPIFSLCGLALTCIAVLVRRELRTGTIR